MLNGTGRSSSGNTVYCIQSDVPTLVGMMVLRREFAMVALTSLQSSSWLVVQRDWLFKMMEGNLFVMYSLRWSGCKRVVRNDEGGKVG